MPEWPHRLLVAATIGLPLGAVAAGLVAWRAVASLESGQEPVAGRLHLRAGVAFMAARDRAFGVEFVQLERLPHGVRNAPLDLSEIPRWAEPIAPDAPPGRWQIGTLAVGWPWRAVARQWNEREPDRGFLPPVELDDDGATIRRAANRFFSADAGAQVRLLAAGAIADVLVFAIPATAVIALLLRRRSGRGGSRPPDQSAGRSGTIH